jgi:hypothetical protein
MHFGNLLVELDAVWEPVGRIGCIFGKFIEFDFFKIPNKFKISIWNFVWN